MPHYNGIQFEPPAPLAAVALRNPDTGAFVPDVNMLLDSGADVTLIPSFTLKALGKTIVPGKLYELMGFDGNTSFAPVVQLELIFCRRTFRGPRPLPSGLEALRAGGRNPKSAIRNLKSVNP